MLTKNEEKVLAFIQDNPFIQQKDLAKKMGLSRPAVANIISQLVRKDYLLGKAYVVNRLNGIVCIGAANVDKKIKSTHELKTYTSNPVTSTKSLGGVARNVAENLGKLGNDVVMMTAVGNDSEWLYVKELSEPFMSMDTVLQVEGQSTGTYTALLDNSGDMYLGLADMSVYDFLTPEWIAKQSSALQHANCIVMDLNCPKETIDYVCSFADKHEKKLVLIAVSEPKMARLPEQLSAVDCLIVNKGETASYFNLTLSTKKDIEHGLDKWLEKGIKRVVLTAGSQDIVVATKSGKTWHAVQPVSSDKVVDVTGAGDAFSGAYIDAWLKDEPDAQCAKAGLANAYHTIQSEYTVRQDLTYKQLKKDMEEYYE